MLIQKGLGQAKDMDKNAKIEIRTVFYFKDQFEFDLFNIWSVRHLNDSKFDQFYIRSVARQL